MNPLVVAADTHPKIFEHALSKVQAGEDLIFRATYVAKGKPTPRVYLTSCKNETFLIKGLPIKKTFRGSDSPYSLERCLFDIIGEAFLAIGFEVVKGLPDRYHRKWVI